MPVDLPPEVIEEAQRAASDYITELGGWDSPAAAQLLIDGASGARDQVIAAYVRAETLREVREWLWRWSGDDPVLDFDAEFEIDRLAEEES